MEIRYQKAKFSDGERLAEIRVKAMKKSLEAIGRFDPQRARDRFLDNFCPEETSLIMTGKTVVGFYSLSIREKELYLAHFYILPCYQGNGLGWQTLTRVRQMAADLNLPLRLGALRGSPSNDFYIKNGFRFTHEDEWDLYYEWESGSQARQCIRDDIADLVENKC